MADKKYITSLVVEADDSQVAKLRDTLQQVSTMMQQIQARGPIGGGPGGGGGWGGGPGGPGGGQGGGGQGGGGDGGGGPGGGQGGPPPPRTQPPGYAGPKQIGMGVAHVAAQQDEGIVSSVMAAAPSAIPIFGAALGIAAGALGAAVMSRGRQAVDFDRQRAGTSGLMRGWRPGVGAGTGLGFTPGESQSVAQTMGMGSGLSGADLFGDTSAVGVGSLYQSGLLAERAGYGAGAVANYLGMFRPGGGGLLGSGAGTDAVKMQAALSLGIGSAKASGLQNADIGNYLNRISGAVTAMADKGVQVDPAHLFATARMLANRSGGGERGGIDAAAATRLTGIGQQVSEGGGSPTQQYYTMMAAGLGKPGVSYYDAMVKAQSGDLDWSAVFDSMRKGSRGDPSREKAYAMKFAKELGFGIEEFRGKIHGDSGEVNLGNLAAQGSRAQNALGGMGVTGFMRQEAGIGAADITEGLKAAGIVLDARSMVHGWVNRAVGPTVDVIRAAQRAASWFGKNAKGQAGAGAAAAASGLPEAEQANPALRGAAAARAMEELDLQAGGEGFDDGSKAATPRPMWRKMPNPASQLPDPKKGGGYIEVRPAPGMERFFQFIHHQDLDGTAPT